MEFKKCSVGTKSYGTGNDSNPEQYRQKGITNVNFKDDVFFEELNN